MLRQKLDYGKYSSMTKADRFLANLGVFVKREGGKKEVSRRSFVDVIRSGDKIK